MSLRQKSASGDVLRVAIDLQCAFIKHLSRKTDLDCMMQELVARTAQVLDATACTVFTVVAGGGHAVQRAGTGYQEQFNGKRDIPVVPATAVPDKPLDGHELGLTGWILSTGKPFVARTSEEVFAHPHYSGRFNELQLPGQDVRLESFLGVPIRGAHGEVIGVLKVERLLAASREVDPFSALDEVALETIARVASRSITYHGLARDGQEAEAITSWARDAIADALSTEGELDSFLDLVVEITAAAMGADSCGIFLRDESGKTLTQRAGIGSHTLRRVIRSYPWPKPVNIERCMGLPECNPPACPARAEQRDGERVGLTAWIAATGQPFYARNFAELSAHCHHKGKYDPVNFSHEKVCGAFVGMPLRIGRDILGVVKVENTSDAGMSDPRDFSSSRRLRFEILAHDIALAIQRLQTRIPERQHIIREAEKTILEILRGGLEVEDLVRKLVKATQALFHAGACALFLREGNRLIQPPWAAEGWAHRGPKVREYELVPLRDIKDDPAPGEKVGLTVWIAVKQEGFTARSNQELKMHPHHKGTFDKFNFDEDEQCESFMGFPLLIREGGRQELVGVLKVESKTKDVDGNREHTYFNELDKLVFELIANSAAIAIQNSRLTGAKAIRERAWQEFSGMTAHRIGTEAAIIRGKLRWLREDLSTGQDISVLEKHLSVATQSLTRVDAFVHEFSQFAAPPELKLRRANVNEICRDVSSFAAPEGPPIRVSLKLADGLPPVWADRERLLDAFKEIFQNAAKAMPQGGTLAVSTGAGKDRARIWIEFTDTGEGVAAAIKERIFEPGFRNRPGGTGLGLALVQKTVRGHKGEIREVGTPGSGARFRIELPAAEMGRPASELEWNTILIVDDNVELRDDLERIVLGDAPNRRVMTASNEVEALGLIAQRCFDAVITDVRLDRAGGGETGGLVVMRAARARDPATPVLVVTAYGKMLVPADGGAGTITVEEQAIRLGCERVILRPDPEKDYLEIVREAIAEVLARRKQSAKAGPVLS